MPPVHKWVVAGGMSEPIEQTRPARCVCCPRIVVFLNALACSLRFVCSCDLLLLSDRESFASLVRSTKLVAKTKGGRRAAGRLIIPPEPDGGTQ